MNPGFVNAVEMLPMPKACDLPPERVDGTRCVWCGRPPTVGLGPRISPIGGALTRWTPQGCGPCVGRKAARVYGLHVGTCPRCSHGEYCPDSRALHKLAVDCR
ncbi:hypothetical protein QF032_003778 [Streptomyces achromogenes]|nr:hypothetical protein [Streptomyces achromogenes]